MGGTSKKGGGGRGSVQKKKRGGGAEMTLGSRGKVYAILVEKQKNQKKRGRGGGTIQPTDEMAGKRKTGAQHSRRNWSFDGGGGKFFRTSKKLQTGEK